MKPLIQSMEETNDILKQTQDAINQLRSENERMANQLKELKDLEARRLLGGDSTAGTQPPKPKVETAKEYAERVMRNEIGIRK